MDALELLKQAAFQASAMSMEKDALDWKSLGGLWSKAKNFAGTGQTFVRDWMSRGAKILGPKGPIRPFLNDTATVISGGQEIMKSLRETAKYLRDLVWAAPEKEFFRKGLKSGLVWGGLGGIAIPSLLSSLTRPRYEKPRYGR